MLSLSIRIGPFAAPALLLTSLISSLAWAGPVEDLLAKPYKPTVAEIKAAFGNKLPQKNPFEKAGGYTKVGYGSTAYINAVAPNAALLTVLKTEGPKVIADFEKIAPGATLAALGRDSSFLGDVFAAFYEGIGQKDRVVRINASGVSLTGDSKDIVGFLKTSGFDLAKLKNRPAFWMFDQTNNEPTSQSRKYLEAIYQEYERQGGDRAELIESFNFINTGALSRTSYTKNQLETDTDIAGFLDEQRKRLTKSLAPPEMISVRVPDNMTYTKEFHGEFSRFYISNGKVLTKPGQLSSEAARRQILCDTFEAIKIAESKPFHDAVITAAQARGYTFPMKRPTTRKEIDAIRLAKGESRYSDEIKALDKKIEASVKKGSSIQKLVDTLSDLPVGSTARAANDGSYWKQVFDRGVALQAKNLIGIGDLGVVIVNSLEYLDLDEVETRKAFADSSSNSAFREGILGAFKVLAGDEEFAQMGGLNYLLELALPGRSEQERLTKELELVIEGAKLGFKSPDAVDRASSLLSTWANNKDDSSTPDKERFETRKALVGALATAAATAAAAAADPKAKSDSRTVVLLRTAFNVAAQQIGAEKPLDDMLLKDETLRRRVIEMLDSKSSSGSSSITNANRNNIISVLSRSTKNPILADSMLDELEQKLASFKRLNSRQLSKDELSENGTVLMESIKNLGTRNYSIANSRFMIGLADKLENQTAKGNLSSSDLRKVLIRYFTLAKPDSEQFKSAIRTAARVKTFAQFLQREGGALLYTNNNSAAVQVVRQSLSHIEDIIDIDRIELEFVVKFFENLAPITRGTGSANSEPVIGILSFVANNPDQSEKISLMMQVLTATYDAAFSDRFSVDDRRQIAEEVLKTIDWSSGRAVKGLASVYETSPIFRDALQSDLDYYLESSELEPKVRQAVLTFVQSQRMRDANPNQDSRIMDRFVDKLPMSGVKGATAEFESQNGDALAAFANSRLGAVAGVEKRKAILDYIDTIAAAARAGKITEADVGSNLGVALRYWNTSDETLMSEFARLYASNEEIRQAWLINKRELARNKAIESVYRALDQLVAKGGRQCLQSIKQKAD